MARLTPLWTQAGSYDGATDRQLIAALYPAGGVSGCAVTPGGGMKLNIAAGHVAVPMADGSTVLCPSTAVETVTLDPAPPSGTNRVDLIVAQVHSVELGDASEEWVFLPVRGAEGGAAPAVPPNAYERARVAVTGGAAAITAADITQGIRPMAVPALAAWATRGTPMEGTYTGQPLLHAVGGGTETISGNFLHLPINPPFPNGLWTAQASGTQWDFPALYVVDGSSKRGELVVTAHNVNAGGSMINGTVGLTWHAIGF
jgi:hypothetical protein